ncbi:acetolactate synthase 2 small subunit [Porticoccaceae bacterium LTM1]|nr:acetolactate synthase 2 small subunit [Porticoccaceae bacterium LTM1]
MSLKESGDMNAVAGNSLVVQCKNESAALERLLRVVRFRGFSVLSFNARLDTSNKFLHVELSVTGERPLHLLENQLVKNYDITSVEVVSTSDAMLQGGRL